MTAAANIPVPEELSQLLNRPLRVGYLSRRFEKYPGTQLMLRMFGLHNRKRVKVYSYAYGSDDGSQERRIVKVG